MSKNKIIGIDLGTSNSVVSILEAGQPIVIVNQEGKRTTPSIVAFTKEGERKVGDPAKRQAVVNPEKTVYTIKRFMGRSYVDSKKDADIVSYNVVPHGTGCGVRIDEKDYRPEEISAMILQKLKKSAEDYLGHEVKEAVITVPAYFNDAQRQSTISAGQIAGLEVKRIINEPTAAALAYGLDKTDKNMKIAVFDLGGGTFDLSILEIGNGLFEVMSTDGDTHLGGEDFDNAIVNWIIEEFKKSDKIDLKTDSKAMQRLKEASELAKIELSSTTETNISLPYVYIDNGTPKNLDLTLSRAKFESMTSNLITRCMEPCKRALSNAKIELKDIDEVILVGGSTRIPKVQEVVRTFFGKEPNRSVNPDEVVAMGAAIQGAVLAGEMKDILLLDVISLSIGLETLGGAFTKLVDANTTIPTRKSETFSTASDNQPSVEIHILQGERTMAKDNKSLGRFHLDGIMPAQRGIPKIEVTLDIDANGILNVSAKDLATNKSNTIRIEASSGLSKEEIERMKRDAEENAESDRIEKEKIDKINHADTLVYSTENQMKELNNKIDEHDKNQLNESISILKSSIESKNLEEIDRYSNELTQIWHTISQKLYSQSEEPNTPNVDPSAENVEFEEVN